MDSSREELHPNWRTLNTVHIPLKRFIKAGSETIDENYTQAYRQHCNDFSLLANEVSGEEIQRFYESLINDSVEQQQVSNVNYQQQQQETNREERHTKRGGVLRKEPFDANKYYRFATENKSKQLKRLIAANADCDINVTDMFGWSALMMAACEGAAEAVQVLLNLGADSELRNKSGQMAIDIAMEKGHFHIVDLLEEHCHQPLESDSTDETTTANLTTAKPFYCDICEETFNETSQNEHSTSTIHKFHKKSTTMENSLKKFNISPKNKGLQLMLKQGWDTKSGLGPDQTGRLYPIKTTIRKARMGLGTEQPPARITHYRMLDKKGVETSETNNNIKTKTRHDIRKEQQRERERERRLRQELS